MNINDIITLKDKDNYLLLESISYKGDNYFFTVKVNEEKNKALGIYDFLKVIDNGNKNKISIVTNKNLKNELYKLLSSKFGEVDE